MKTLTSLLVLTTVLTIAAVGQTTKGESKVIGEVVDIQNYVAYGMKPDNPDRQAMALNGLKAGNPLGILERSTGKIYVVTTSQTNTSVGESLKEYLGMKVFVKGKVYKKGGMQLIIMSDIGPSAK